MNIDTLRGKVSVEKNKETASIIVEMTKDPRYMEYYKKIRELTQQDKQNICNYIDYIVFNAKNNL